MKKMLAIILTVFISTPTLCFAFDDISAEVDQIQSFINDGQYLEAIQVCNETSAWHILSDADKALLNDLLWEAENSYSTYLSSYDSTPTAYDDISNEVEQIMSFIDDGLYLEAIQVCNETSAWHTLSDADKALLNDLLWEAKNSYNEYMSYLDSIDTYTMSSWNMCFSFYNNYTPYQNTSYRSNNQYVTVMNNSSGSIEIHSYRNGSREGLSITVYNASQYISDYVSVMKKLAYQGDEGYNYFEVLSENNTSVNGMAARQATIRRTSYIGSKAYYDLIRCTAFDHDGYVYTIVARQNTYSWTDSFWDKMELVRNSIYFY